MDSRRSRLDVTSISRAPGREAPARIVPVFTGLGIVHVNAPYDYPPHRHPAYQVIFVDTGHYIGSINDTELHLKANDVLIVKPGDIHSDRCRPPLRYFGLTFHLDPRWYGEREPMLFTASVTPEQQVFHANRNSLWPLIKAIQKEADTGDPVAPHVQDALLLQLFWRIVRALPRDVVSEAFLDLTGDHAFPTRVKRFMHTHMGAPLTVPEIAERLHMSESSLSHKCRELIGESPAKLLLRIRMERAVMLLKNSDMPVKEIALRVGYEDPYHFSRAFKRHFGSSPSSLR